MSIKININIAGKAYPLTISEKEEAVVRASEIAIQANIDRLKNQYKINDAQDLLAMTVLEFATKLENAKNGDLTQEDKLNLSNLKAMLDNVN